MLKKARHIRTKKKWGKKDVRQQILRLEGGRRGFSVSFAGMKKGEKDRPEHVYSRGVKRGKVGGRETKVIPCSCSSKSGNALEKKPEGGKGKPQSLIL